jgi:TonB family protein
MHLYARFLEQQGRGDEAALMEKQARDITQASATEFAREAQGPPGTTVHFASQAVLAPNGSLSPAGGGGAGRGAASGDPMMPPGTPGGAFRVGGGVSAPVLLSKTEPEYTEEARAAKYSGTVLLYIEIGPDGIARNFRVMHGLGLGLDEKAIQAVRNWKFKPGSKDGQPVTVQATIEVNFRLE